LSGKTTLFNALTRVGAPAGGAAGKASVAAVPVPDPRVDVLAELERSRKRVFVQARFVDVAGLSAGAGGGLAAQGLGALREADALAMVLAAFDGSDPAEAAAELTLELTVADLSFISLTAVLPALLEAMGATVTRDGALLTVQGPEALHPVDADLAAMPDQVTTVAALAALATGPSRLRGVAVARGHETDRLAALAAELAKLGVAVTELPDGLVVAGAGPDRLRPARLATHGDHRMAMALAAVAARVPGVVLEDPACVAKTYPGFWRELAAAGLAWRARPGRVE